MGSMPMMSPFVRAKLYLPIVGAAAPNSISIHTRPDLVDFNAQHNGDHVFCYQARKHDSGTRLIEITHAQLRDAVLRCQAWLRTHVAGHMSKSRPVALFMESDVGLWIHMLALLGLGVPPLLLSARLSPHAVQHLLEKTNAGAALASTRMRATVEEALTLVENNSVDSLPGVLERRPLEEWLTGDHVDAESAAVSGFYQSVQDREVVIMHSSGTTGLPKPIYQPHEYLVGFAAAHRFGEDEEPPYLNLSTLPLYHVRHRSPCSVVVVMKAYIL